MRQGGAFAFGGQTIPVELAPGGVFYPPAGNYLLSTGGQTAIQWFDPILQSWRAYAPPGSVLEFLPCDGFNFRLVNLSGTVVGTSITNAGANGTNGIGPAATSTSVSFGAAPTNGVAATGYAIVGGSVSVSLVNGAPPGTFLIPPLVLIDPPPPGGIQATAHVTLNNGSINSVVTDNPGAGYGLQAAPNVYLVAQMPSYGGGTPGGLPAAVYPPAGSAAINNPIAGAYPQIVPVTGLASTAGGAQLTAALTGSGTLTGLVMVNFGANYTGTSIPTISFTGTGAPTGAAATALMSMALTGLTVGTPGAGYPATNPIFETSLGLVGNATGFNNGNLLSSRSARGIAVVNAGSLNNGTTNIIEDPGFGFQKVPQVAVIPTAGSQSVTTQGTFTAVVGGIADISFMQPAVQ